LGIIWRQHSKLTLGTVALGQRYGVSNPSAKLSVEMASAILDRSWERGIFSIDTAAAYGDAEPRIGAWIRDTGNQPTVVSKAPSLSEYSDDEVAQTVSGFIAQSLTRLNCRMLDGYLLHRAEDWRREPVRGALQRAKDNGTVKAIGLSGYEPRTLLELMAIEPVDIIQVPISLFDCSAERTGLLIEAVERDVYVMARSVFLQGLLFMNPSTLPAHREGAAPVLTALRQLAAEAQTDLGTLALRSVLETDGVSTAVLGFYNVAQVDEACDAQARTVDRAILDEARRISNGLPLEITDPRRWPTV